MEEDGFILTQPRIDQLQAAGGSVTYNSFGGVESIFIPSSLLNTPLADDPTFKWSDYILYNVPLVYTATAVTPGIHTGTLNPGQVQYTTAYDANIVAQGGHTVIAKGMNINTGNKVAATQSNLNAQTLLTYIATSDGGNVVGSENLLIDGAGNFTPASDRMLCPFVGGSTTIIPAYCNIVQAGSSYDLTAGSVTTSANDRFVGTDATVPVALNYNINVKPYDTTSGSVPALGSVSAYIKVHVQEARGETAYNNSMIGSVYFDTGSRNYLTYAAPTKAEDLQYSEVTSASGVISTFAKSMGYSSQATSTKLNVVPGVITHLEQSPP